MLVLTRKPEEVIVIDNQITVKVLAIKGNRVCVGIEAPAEVPIRRSEIDPFYTTTLEMGLKEVSPVASLPAPA